MGDYRQAISRELTPEEVALIEWLLEPSDPALESFRSQVWRLAVVGKCTCGCPTVDFALKPALHRRMGHTERLFHACGFTRDGKPVDVLLHVRDGELSELEVAPAAQDTAVALPRPEELTRL